MDNRTKKTNNKRFVRYPEGAEMYSMSLSKFQQLAKDAKACYKMNRLVLVNLDILDEYLETFHIIHLTHMMYQIMMIQTISQKSGLRNSAMVITMMRMIIGRVNGIERKDWTQ